MTWIRATIPPPPVTPQRVHCTWTAYKKGGEGLWQRFSIIVEFRFRREEIALKCASNAQEQMWHPIDETSDKCSDASSFSPLCEVFQDSVTQSGSQGGGGTYLSVWRCKAQIKEEVATDASLVATNYHQYHFTTLSSIPSLERQKYPSMPNCEIDAFPSPRGTGLPVLPLRVSNVKSITG